VAAGYGHPVNVGVEDDRLKQALASVRPLRSWLDAATAAGVDVWTRKDEDEWTYADPPEELALPPLIDWSDDLKRLALSAYRATFDKYLEVGQCYVLIWPPEASLSRSLVL